MICEKWVSQPAVPYDLYIRLTFAIQKDGYKIYLSYFMCHWKQLVFLSMKKIVGLFTSTTVQKNDIKETNSNDVGALKSLRKEDIIDIKEVDLPTFYKEVEMIIMDCQQSIMFGDKPENKYKMLNDMNKKIDLLEKIPSADILLDKLKATRNDFISENKDLFTKNKYSLILN